MTVLTLTITFHKGEILNANHRHHWREKARRTAAVRNRAMLARLANKGPMLDRARVDAVFEFPDRRKRDRSNLMPTVKAAIDGAVLGPPKTPDWPHKILPDDSDRYLDGPHLHVIGGATSVPVGQVRLTLTFAPLGEAGTPLINGRQGWQHAVCDEKDN